MKIKKTDILVAVMVLAVILLIIVPLSPDMLDIFIIGNITLSLLILLTTLFTKKTLEFSTFPTVLLIVTLFRLALNIASTRLILGNGGNAGHVIRAFGEFVVGGNLVVGLVIFLIIVAVQFIVITKGAERVSEVAARFTLDAMPGKQMAIDADLSAGNISEEEARERRQEIQREGQLRLQSAETAAIRLRGTLLSYRLDPMRYDQNRPKTVAEYRVVVRARIEAVEAATGKAIVAQTVVGDATLRAAGDLTTARRAALPEAARQAAHEIVNAVVSAW